MMHLAYILLCGVLLLGKGCNQYNLGHADGKIVLFFYHEVRDRYIRINVSDLLDPKITKYECLFIAGDIFHC